MPRPRPRYAVAAAAEPRGGRGQRAARHGARGLRRLRHGRRHVGPRWARLAQARAARFALPPSPSLGAHHPLARIDSLRWRSYVPALNDALSLTAFTELRCSYVPLYGSTALRAALDVPPERAAPSDWASQAFGVVTGGGRESLYSSSPLVTAPPLLQPRAELRYHTAAPIAALLDAVTLPYRARQAKGSVHALVTALCPQGGMCLGSAVLGVPMPSSAAALGSEGWLAPLLPFQRPPHASRAFQQHVCWLGHSGGGEKETAYRLAASAQAPQPTPSPVAPLLTSCPLLPLLPLLPPTPRQAAPSPRSSRPCSRAAARVEASSFGHSLSRCPSPFHSSLTPPSDGTARCGPPARLLPRPRPSPVTLSPLRPTPHPSALPPLPLPAASRPSRR